MYLNLLLVSSFVLFNNNSYSQEEVLLDEKQFLNRKVQLAFMGGFSKAGIEVEIENKMKEVGLNSTSSNWLFGGSTTYPLIVRDPIYDLELTYH